MKRQHFLPSDEVVVDASERIVIEILPRDDDVLHHLIHRLRCRGHRRDHFVGNVHPIRPVRNSSFVNSISDGVGDCVGLHMSGHCLLAQQFQYFFLT